MISDINKDFIQLRDVSKLSHHQTSPHSATPHLGSTLEYVKMVFSYLKTAYGIYPGTSEISIKIYEDEIGGGPGALSEEAPEIEDRILTPREEALKSAVLLKQVYHLFRKGSQS